MSNGSVVSHTHRAGAFGKLIFEALPGVRGYSPSFAEAVLRAPRINARLHLPLRGFSVFNFLFTLFRAGSARWDSIALEASKNPTVMPVPRYVAPVCGRIGCCDTCLTSTPRFCVGKHCPPGPFHIDDAIWVLMQYRAQHVTWHMIWKWFSF